MAIELFFFMFCICSGKFMDKLEEVLLFYDIKILDSCTEPL